MAASTTLTLSSKSHFSQWSQSVLWLSGPMLGPVFIYPMLTKQATHDKQDNEMDNSITTIFFNIHPTSAVLAVRMFISFFVSNDYHTLPCFVSV